MRSGSPASPSRDGTPDNRIVPAFDQPDAIAVPRPRISFSIGSYVRNWMADAAALHERLVEELDATDRNHSDIAFGAGHVMGNTKMGTTPPPRWWKHPTLALAALALRTAAAMVR